MMKSNIRKARRFGFSESTLAALQAREDGDRIVRDFEREKGRAWEVYVAMLASGKFDYGEDLNAEDDGPYTPGGRSLANLAFVAVWTFDERVGMVARDEITDAVKTTEDEGPDEDDFFDDG